MGDWMGNVDVVDEDEPIEGNPNLVGWARDGVYILVGNGSITKSNCGTFAGGFMGCDDNHEGLTYKGEDASGKGYFRPIICSCHKLSCPLCYESACAREAHAIEDRLKALSEQFGLVEHIVVSVPLEKYYLAQHEPEKLRRLVIEALERRGVFGGCLIYHHFRYNKFRKFWYRSIHFHVLGWIKGGYGRCRNCVNHICEGYNREFERCDGWDAHTRGCFEVDGMIVKVAEDMFGVRAERKSVYQTSRYQLSHASIRVDCKRSGCVFWFGVASYHKFKFKVEKRKGVCPICGRELHRFCFIGRKDLLNFGSQVFVTNRCSPLFKSEFLFPLRGDKRDILWVTVPFWGSGSSERMLGESPFYEVRRLNFGEF